jgi:hypothetical protein
LQDHSRLQAASAAASKETFMEPNAFHPFETRFIDRLVSALVAPRDDVECSAHANAAETADAWARAFAECQASSYPP